MTVRARDLLRAQAVKRWHIVDTARQQTVAEHQWNVAMLAARMIDIAVELGWNCPHDEKRRIIVDSLVHDLHEIDDGDVPSSAKPPEVERIDDPSTAIRQVCDKIDALWFIINYGIGEHATKTVTVDCEQRLYRVIGAIQSERLTKAAYALVKEVFDGQ